MEMNTKARSVTLASMLVLAVACGDEHAGAIGGAGASAGKANGAGGSAGTAGGAAGGNSGTTSAPPPEDFPVGFGEPEVFIADLTRCVRVGLHDGYLYFTEMGLED